MAKHHIEATVNGDAVEFLCETEETLLDVLRDTLTSPAARKAARPATAAPAASCSTAGWSAPASCWAARWRAARRDDRGHGQGREPPPAAAEVPGTLQCGICTPGFLVAGKALLERTTNPTEHEIRYWLAGNLCRCTGYDKIVSAVMDAAAR